MYLGKFIVLTREYCTCSSKQQRTRIIDKFPFVGSKECNFIEDALKNLVNPMRQPTQKFCSFRPHGECLCLHVILGIEFKNAISSLNEVPPCPYQSSIQ